MAADPPNRFARFDVRPPAGANPELPGFAEGDHVLHKWVLEERARRRRFLADQVLEPCEPLPRVRHSHPLLRPFVKAYDGINRSVGYRISPITRNVVLVGLFLFPMWYVHYMTKYHWKGTFKLQESNPTVYPKKDLGDYSHH